MGNVIPATLGDVMDKDLIGFQQVIAFYLELQHGLMGFFPALISETGEIVVCLDEELLGKVKELLPKRQYRQGQFQMLANIKGCYGFNVGNRNDKAAKSLHILTEEEFSQRSHEEKPFKWTSGLIGDDMSEDEFNETLRGAAEKVHD